MHELDIITYALAPCPKFLMNGYYMTVRTEV